MSHYGSLTVRDYSKELSAFKVYFAAITSLNIGDILSQWGALKTAVADLSIGTFAKEHLALDDTLLSRDIPTDADVQRERKWLITYEGDTSHKLFTCSIPCATYKDSEGNSLLMPGTDDANMAEPEITAFVTAFETLAKSPDSDAETVTVVSMRAVGRNL